MDYSILKSSVLKELKNNASLQKQLKAIAIKCQKGTVGYRDALDFSELLGEKSAQLIKKHIGDGEGLVLSEFAEQFIEPLYTEIQRTALTATKAVQRNINTRNGLGINASDVKPDKSRVQHIVARYREAESFDTVSFLLGEDVIENITRSAVNDSIRASAYDQERAGFKVVMVRTDGSGCCDYCSGLVGTYERGHEPDDFWKVHKGCSCEFEYHSSITGSNHKISFSTNSEGKLTKNTKDR